MTTVVRDEIDDLVDWQLTREEMGDVHIRPMFEEVEDHLEDGTCVCEGGTRRWEGSAMHWVPGLGPVSTWMWRSSKESVEAYRKEVERLDATITEAVGPGQFWMAD